MLVTTAELANHLHDPAWMLFDTRHDLIDTTKGPREYSQGHIEGAHFLSIDDDLSAAKTGTNGRHPLPDAGAFAARMAALGASPDHQFVIYDGTGGMYAARLWWMLRWIGAPNVALLDGGIAKWMVEKRPVTPATPRPRTPVANGFKPQSGLTVDAGDVLAHLGDAQRTVLDARAGERYRGEVEPIDPVAGHIPDAVNRFWQANLNPDGTFKTRDDLHREYSQVLAGRPPSAIVHQCGSGVTACHNLFAMEWAGLAGSRLYPGSWSEWVADPSRPVAKA
ncbi:MAG: sulfurtransferase [Betaproteobacteria bacterium]|nr:sulfurtransferase [Betaproteobacteria bacterium]